MDYKRYNRTMITMDLDKLISVKDAANELGVSVARVHQLIKAYDIPRVVLNTRFSLISRRHIEKLREMDRPSGRHRQ